MSSPDQLQHFLFSNADIRGQLVGLQQSYQEVLENHQYPEPIQKLIGEFIAAAALLSGTIKIDGTLTVQAQGKGGLSLIMAECGSNQEVRAIARWQGEPDEGTFRELVEEGQLVITIDPDEGQRYQGIVPLEGDSLAQCLESYFDQSEQLKTRIWLATDPGECVAGLLLQAMPSTNEAADQDAWPRICLLSDTLSDKELLTLQNVTLIYRLYNEEEINLYPPSTIVYECSCNRDRTINALVALGQDEVEEIFAEQQQVEVKCEFCNKGYQLKHEDLEPYMMEKDIAEVANDLAPSRTLH